MHCDDPTIVHTLDFPFVRGFSDRWWRGLIGIEVQVKILLATDSFDHDFSLGGHVIADYSVCDALECVNKVFLVLYAPYRSPLAVIGFLLLRNRDTN